MQKISRAYIKHYDIINMSQLLPTGRHVHVQWIRAKTNCWHPTYSTDSTYHICSFTGEFKDCKDCIAYNEDFTIMLNNCTAISEGEEITDEEMASRATACANAEGCTIEFRSFNV